MSLASSLDAACYNLHHLLPYDNVEPDGEFHIVATTKNSRVSFGGSWFLRPIWHATTPPCFISLTFYQVNPLYVVPNPAFVIRGICNECGEGVVRLGSAHWFRMQDIVIQNFGSAYTQVKQVHVQYAHTNAGSIGFFETGWPG